MRSRADGIEEENVLRPVKKGNV